MKPKGYWTKDKCQEEALKYKTRIDFKKKSPAYSQVVKNKWLYELCSHMTYLQKPKDYWTKEKCQEEALKYDTKNEFKNNSMLYYYSIKNNWLNDICKHMKEIRKPNGYWCYDKCKEESIKYETRSDFQKYSSSAYKKSQQNGWLEEICLHMFKPKNLSYRCIYACEFEDNCVYVGLTNNIKTRKNKHLTYKNGPVYKHIKETNTLPNFIKLTEYLCVEEAILNEGKYVDKYKNDGWKILNSAKTGSVGSNIIYWTKEKCYEESLKYNKITEFMKKSAGAYGAAYRNGWIYEFNFKIKKR
jgi:predicted GIY-YIG superfamily endonuclease